MWISQIKFKEFGEVDGTIDSAVITVPAQFNPEEKEIVKLRYYIGKTQMEVSEEIGISQAQVSRLEKNAIKEIKKAF